ncbi:Protein patched/dispatched,Sterol-sensing domain [Cinara cedri]|uniref:Protein patched/dispatched,Sterol-sensing domain n=1 Tax=Cinara cedri TaxID=506608 RepID=A0A5E4NSD7_9HEMI|nr:Protein patched/dispatched,Sterol-sensing domain [Cinara cedri]
MFDWYVKVLVNHPRRVITIVVLLCTSTILIPYLMGRLPQFSHPELGFETRGTEIGNRQVAWDNLIKALEKGTELIDDITRIPSNMLPQHYSDMVLRKIDVINKITNLNSDMKTTNENKKILLPHTTELEDETFEETEMTLRNDKKRRKNRLDFFCSKPTYDHARVVFTLNQGENLFTYQAVKDMCLIQEHLANLIEYKDVCDTQEQTCCPPWSLVNYIALLKKHKSCSEIIPKDINSTATILEGCAHFYHDNELFEWKMGYRNIPRQCIQFSAVYNLMHYHLDMDFMPPHAPTKFLTSSMMFLPFGKGSIVHLYKAMKDANLSTPLVKISAIDFGIKETLFDLEIVRDIYLIFLSTFFIMLCVLFYTWSLIITFVTLLNIIFSLSVSYFMYTFIFQIHFFPFMNVLAIIVLIGVSADSSFIMCDVWKAIKMNDQADSLVDVISKTLKHSLLSISLSTTTTFCAFASSFLSAINGISCFSIFSAMAVLVNLLITSSLLPSCIVLLSSQHSQNIVVFDFGLVDKFLSMERMLHQVQTKFNAWLLKIVFRFRWVWIIFFFTLGLLSATVLWIWPGIKLPESVEFQLFRESHPFEQYDLIYKNQFWFERILRIDNNPENRVPLRFVWGLLPSDNGNHLNPEDHGNLVYDPEFDIAHPKSQVWLLEFCENLRRQPFYRAVGGPQMTNCFIETFIKWMSHNCINNLELNRWPCCNSYSFPYPRNIFHFCILKAMYIVYSTPSTIFIPSVAGPKFSNPLFHPLNQTFVPIIKAVVVEFESNFAFTTSYVYMEAFYKQVEAWSSKMMEKAPPGLKKGWFYSHLGFYDLQKMLIEDTIMSAFIALFLAFIIMFIVTTSISLTVITVVTIFFIISTTIAVLVLMGWRLNVLESIATSVAIGLSVDFSLHYTIEYQLACEDSPRATAISKALSLMACPSLMGAITTGASGAFMLPSDVLPYAQLGVFLIIIMFISWFYSTFFLVSLLSVFGSDDHGPYPYHCCRKLRDVNVNAKHKRCSRHASPFSNVASESTVSCISTAIVNQSPAHELDILTVHPVKFQPSNSKAATSSLYLNIDNDNLVKKSENNVVHI